MRLILMLSCLMMGLASFAQTKSIHGRVTDSAGKGIAFAIVQAKGTYNGIYADEQGNFKIDMKAEDGNILIFYCMGYEAKELPMAAGGEMMVQLVEKPNALDEVSIVANKPRNTSRVKILGKSKLKCDGQAYMNVGTEYGIYLKNSAATNGTLDEVMVYITDIGIPNSRFRIHIYDANERSRLPVKDITGGNIIANAEKGNEWVRINVSDKNIKIDGSIIISIEWISGYGNNPEIKNKGVMKYQGQVMGLTTSYGEQSKYVKFLFEDNRQAANWEWLVPMIYCTYHK